MEQIVHPYVDLPRLPEAVNWRTAHQRMATRARQLMDREVVWLGDLMEYDNYFTGTFQRGDTIYTGIMLRHNVDNVRNAKADVLDLCDQYAESRFIDVDNVFERDQAKNLFNYSNWGWTPAYSLVEKFYGDTRAERSGVLKMNHIDEATTIISRAVKYLPQYQDCDYKFAIKAFHLHPLVQSDGDLAKMYAEIGDLPGKTLILAMEYRSVANEYLSHRTIQSIDEIRLSPLPEVNLMLIGDKVQNYKDFVKYHQATHPRARELCNYFQNWMDRLGVTEGLYRKLIKHIPDV